MIKPTFQYSKNFVKVLCSIEFKLYMYIAIAIPNWDDVAIGLLVMSTTALISYMHLSACENIHT